MTSIGCTFSNETKAKKQQSVISRSEFDFPDFSEDFEAHHHQHPAIVISGSTTQRQQDGHAGFLRPEGADNQAIRVRFVPACVSMVCQLKRCSHQG